MSAVIGSRLAVPRMPSVPKSLRVMGGDYTGIRRFGRSSFRKHAIRECGRKLGGLDSPRNFNVPMHQPIGTWIMWGGFAAWILWAIAMAWPARRIRRLRLNA